MTAVDPGRLVGGVGEDELRAFVLEQRWFASKAREVAHLALLEAPIVRTEPPLLALALVETRFHPGTHELYQLPLGFRPDEDGWSDGVVARPGGWVAYDAMADPELTRELVRLMHRQQTVETADGRIEFRTVGGLGQELGDLASVRPMGVEQSNTSVVFDERLVLKVFRRLEPGINPELELLRFLTERGFPGIAALEGWAAYVGQPLDATLAVLQEFVTGEGDGWALALASLGGDRDRFFAQIRRLGELTGAMHTVLASDNQDAAFCPEEPSGEALAILSATIDEEIERVFLSLPDDPAVEPIASRGEEVREQLRQRTQAGRTGRMIRHHGDYHLGQVLWTGDDWVILDFEGEPARALPERRRKRSPLRDVAGMLRSFAYAASAHTIEHGGEHDAEWERRAREEFVAGYRGEVDPGLVPAGEGFDNLLAIFELEKAIYELRYELNNRPDWVAIPVAGIVRILDGTSS